MKKMKRLVALALSVVMVLAMSVVAFAEGNTTYTITAPKTSHQYEIYQIFTGDLHEGVLSNVKWGQNGTGTQGEAVADSVLDELKNVKNVKSDTEKLAVIEKYAILSNPVATITNGATYKAAAGYYLIKDANGSVSGTDSYTTYIVEVVGNVTITPKSDVPNFEKKLKDTNDTTGETSGWQDSADYDIGDKIPFQLKGTVAKNYDAYKTYYFAFHDKEEEGLTFDASSVKVYVDGTQITSGYEVKTPGETHADCTFEVVFDNLKNIASVKAGSKITVEYESTLNDKAVLGSQGNVNQAKLEFSNNPNDAQGGEKGETPWDNVIVFTYQVVVNKVDENKDPLTGAEFTLVKNLENGGTKTIAVVKAENGTQFNFKGLDDGEYTLSETTTPNGYNTISPITFTVTADHNIEWKTGKRTTILTELKGGDKFTGNVSTGNLTGTIENKKGASLPSTGGIGTTIFYVVGGILMVGAAVLLITKRRTEN